jgi:creatinine amidohydrolase/Fe(II)-dependent formamide hydrolase-like protein
MNTEQIKALDRQKTVVILPGGILEEHGPYLPSYSDGFFNERLTQAVADSVASRPGWVALVFPMIPLGNGPADEIGGLYTFPGSYPVRFATLRAVFMDLATELGEQGFRWIFVIHGHGGPNHNRALDQAGDYFRDTYGGRMVNVVGLLPVMSAWGGKPTAEEKLEDGLSIHAGMGETSSVLFLRPDLVAPGYKSARPYADPTMEGLVRIAHETGWPGYFGSPRLAQAAKGEADFREVQAIAIGLVSKILDGLDERTIPRYTDEMKKSPPDVAIDRASLAHEARTEQRMQAWLRGKGLLP